MSVQSFIPEIWSANILDVLKKDLVFGNLANRDYEGEISQFGDTVRINEIGDITIRAYTKNSTTAITVQQLTDAQQILQIDQANYFAFGIDDVDVAQTKPKLLPMAISRAAYNLKDTIDQNLASYLSTTGNFFVGTNSTELGSTVTPLSCASTAVIVAFSWYDRIMSQNRVPTQGRWMVIPPAISQQLQMAKIIAPQGMTNGSTPNAAVSIGNYYGFDLYVSNNTYGVPSSQWHVIAGHSMGFSYADQINKVEAFRPEAGFSDAIKGLSLFGRKVTRPNCIIKGVLTSS
jgi:hypothetical protein